MKKILFAICVTGLCSISDSAIALTEAALKEAKAKLNQTSNIDPEGNWSAQNKGTPGGIMGAEHQGKALVERTDLKHAPAQECDKCAEEKIALIEKILQTPCDKLDNFKMGEMSKADIDHITHDMQHMQNKGDINDAFNPEMQNAIKLEGTMEGDKSIHNMEHDKTPQHYDKSLTMEHDTNLIPDGEPQGGSHHNTLGNNSTQNLEHANANQQHEAGLSGVEGFNNESGEKGSAQSEHEYAFNQVSHSLHNAASGISDMTNQEIAIYRTTSEHKAKYEDGEQYETWIERTQFPKSAFTEKIKKDFNYKIGSANHTDTFIEYQDNKTKHIDIVRIYTIDNAPKGEIHKFDANSEKDWILVFEEAYKTLPNNFTEGMKAFISEVSTQAHRIQNNKTEDMHHTLAQQYTSLAKGTRHTNGTDTTNQYQNKSIS